MYDIALLSRVPGMTVMAPSSAQELHQMLHDAYRPPRRGPVVIRYPKGQARQVPDLEVGSGSRRGGCGRATAAVRVLALGKLVGNAERAADPLADEGVDAHAVGHPGGKPLDPAMIADAARHELVVTAEDGIREGGVGLTLADRCITCAGRPSPRVEVLGVPTRSSPTAKPDHILAGLGLDGDGIAARCAARRP